MTHAVAASLVNWCCVLQADKRARQRAKDKERKDSKPATAAAADSSKPSAGTAAAGGDSFDAELAAAMAEAAAISSR
jgi:hypothetical protein